MKHLQNPFSRTFWYRLFLILSLSRILKREGIEPAIVKAINSERARLEKSNASLVQDGPSHYHLTFCASLLAIYRELAARGQSREQAMAIAQSTVFAALRADELAGMVKRKLARARDPFAEMVHASKLQEQRFYGDTFRFSRPVDQPSEYLLNVDRCFYQEFFVRNQATELMRIACAWDLVTWSRGIDPVKHGFFFERPVTLGLDGKPCEFHFQRNSAAREGGATWQGSPTRQGN